MYRKPCISAWLLHGNAIVTANDLFIKEHANDDINRLALQRNRYPDVDIDFALQQIEGRQRTKEKLPTLYNIENWHYPKRLSIEQCSSEETARYKATLVQGDTLVDLTGGFGIDTFFLSEHFAHTDYVERHEELCSIARHNFTLLGRAISVHNTTGEEFLATMSKADCIYIDPARRSATGGKVFKLEDCEPDIGIIYETVRAKCDTLLLKLSPMLDISAALHSLPQATEVHVIGVKGEVKEILIHCDFRNVQDAPPVHIRTINIRPKGFQRFDFTPTQEREEECEYANQIATYLYEPNLCILKAGAFKSIGKHYQLQKLAQNTHLYTSDRLIHNFPGRIFHILSLPDKKELHGKAFNVITRNHPQSTDILRCQLKIKEGGNSYLIGTRIADKPMLLLAERVLE